MFLLLNGNALEVHQYLEYLRWKLHVCCCKNSSKQRWSPSKTQQGFPHEWAMTLYLLSRRAWERLARRAARPSADPGLNVPSGYNPAVV